MKNKPNIVCRICNGKGLGESYYPEVHFNDKIFKYYRCDDCSSFNVFPTPEDEDFTEMYGENDHTYLKDVEDKLHYDFNYEFANHQGFQIQFLAQIKNELKGCSLLDYGCGSGFYMKYAQNYGANVAGVEFDVEFVNLLKTKTDLAIYTFDDLINNYKGKTFDFIHVGHVLEHLPNPHETFNQLKKFAHKNTVFLIDGPLERNFCLHRLYVDLGSKFKAKKYREAVPQHLTLTTQKSQLRFFQEANLKKEKYLVVEQYFPLPSKLEKSAGKVVSYFVASISILLSSIIPFSGNIFHYRGKINDA